MIWFCCFCKKTFFVLGVADSDPFFMQVGPKMVIFRGFKLIPLTYFIKNHQKKWAWSWGKI